ncbi:MAG: HAMP domain-containing sensor histidine kinase [Dysgonomonas sp.]
MKLVNHLTIRISGIFILILLIWSIAYLAIQLNEIHNGIDEGLNNLKQEFLLQANKEPGFMEAMEKHDPLNIIVRKLSLEEALNAKEKYSNSKIYFISEEEDEEVRMLTTVFFCELDKQYYELKLFTSTVESEDLIKNMIYLLTTLWICLALALIFAGKKIISKTNRPFYLLLDKLKNFNLDKSQMIDFPKTSISEYAELNSSVEILLSENIKTFNEQKNFIENASHELQTPLAVSISKLELFMSRYNLSEEQLIDMSTILKSLNRMKRLNRNMLLLSKIRNKQFIKEEYVNLTALLKTIINEFEDFIEHKEIELTFEQQEEITFYMNADLAYILLANLIKNAITHNVEKGKIDIHIRNHKIEISNTGIELPSDQNIFERYTIGTDNVKSSGLGLSIVKSITDLYKIKISHCQKNKVHTITLFFENK